MKKIVIALGGNALGNDPKEQIEKAQHAAKAIAPLIAADNQVAICHGNGPQVGMINLAFEAASRYEKEVPEMPLCECTAMSQGYIGFHLQNALEREIGERTGKKVTTVLTRVLVSEDDDAFWHKTKPIGAFYDEKTANELAQKNGYEYINDANRGFRRVVASPKPTDILEKDVIKQLLDKGQVVIACGGGGIPVAYTNESLLPMPSVVDKDFAASLLAVAIKADMFFILTTVDKVCINFSQPFQQEIDEMDVPLAKKYISEGHFKSGSMLPKVQAAVEFVEKNKGSKAIIASLENAKLAFEGKAGTKIFMDKRA